MIASVTDEESSNCGFATASVKGGGIRGENRFCVQNHVVACPGPKRKEKVAQQNTCGTLQTDKSQDLTRG